MCYAHASTSPHPTAPRSINSKCNRLQLSRVDYCNALLAGTSSYNIARLQRAQNIAAKVVCRAARLDSPKPLLHRLHWLPVQQRIDYKRAVLTFNAMCSSTPVYIRDLLSAYEPTRALRSSGTNLLVIPSSNNKTALDGKAFQNYAPKLWNSLPERLRAIAQFGNPENIAINYSGLSSFKHSLKTVLFTTAFLDL